MAARVDTLETIGLDYQQHGKIHRSKHFDFTPLKEALQGYINGFTHWNTSKDWDAMDKAFMLIGEAQRDVPAHIAQEYCRLDRSFSPTPLFFDKALPRGLTFHDFSIRESSEWFPLFCSNSGLGFDFSLVQGTTTVVAVPRVAAVPIQGELILRRVRADLAAIHHLECVRGMDNACSRHYLNSPAAAPVSALSP